ncbi:MAG: diguanylate cyclase domain-containing protein [Gammaproteobacteria bacterium]
MHVSASIGIAVLPDDTLDIDELVDQADLAMFRQKRQRKGGPGAVPALSVVS